MSNSVQQDPGESEQGATAIDTLIYVAERWKLLVLAPLAIGLLALGITYLITPTFTARTSFLTPTPQGGAASALAALGPLAGLAGAAGGLRTPAEQYVALLRSRVIQDRVIDRFDLIKVYDSKYRSDARRDLEENVRITLSKREGMIDIEVEDHSRERAADMANAHVDELRRLASTLAITEAQQRRLFFESQLAQTRDRLAAAQKALQDSGFNQGALKAEPKAAAEAYARLRAEETATQVRLQALRGSLADEAPEVRQQLAALSTIRAQLARTEQITDPGQGADYVGKYREFKYQETLFDLFARQFELARVDEAREGALVQTIDVAQPPDKKSKPKRLLVALVATGTTAFLLLAIVMLQVGLRRIAADPHEAAQLARLRRALSLR